MLSIFCRMLNPVDDQYVQLRTISFDLETELLLKCRDQRGRCVRRFAVPCSIKLDINVKPTRESVVGQFEEPRVL